MEAQSVASAVKRSAQHIFEALVLGAFGFELLGLVWWDLNCLVDMGE